MRSVLELNHAFVLIATLSVMVLCAPGALAEDTARVSLNFDVFQEDRPLAIEEVCCGQIVFSQEQVSSTSAGFGGNPVWIRLPELRPGTILSVSSIVDEATLYEQTDEGWTVSRTGDSVEPQGSALPIPRMAFFLSENVEPGAARYLRIVQPSPITFGLAAWDTQAFRSDFETRRIIQMLLLGFITAIIAYNLVVSALTRDIVFALNALTIVALLFIDLYLTGLGAYYIWPRPLSNIVLIVALACATVFGALFISHFLFHNIAHPSARPLRIVAAGAVAICATSLVLPYWYPQTALIGIILIMPVTAMTIAGLQILRRNGNAYLLIFPLLGIMLLGGAMVAVRSFTEFSFGAIHPHMLEVTLALEALTFSLALAARIRSQELAIVSARAKLAEAEYKGARRYTELQERERARIAADLHDSIGHNLVMISGLMENSIKNGAQRDDLASAAGLTRRTIRQIRQLSHALHPSTLSDLGWDAAIEGLFGELERSCGIAVSIELTGGEPDLSDEAKLHLYRILQEIVSNVAKHSAARNCRATFDNDGDTLTIRIADDGYGPPKDGKMSGNLGFASIEERLKNIGGSWEINRDSQRGFETLLTVPIRKVAKDAGSVGPDGTSR